MTPELFDAHQETPKATSETSGIHGLLIKYRHAVHALLWGGAIVLWFWAGNLAAEYSAKHHEEQRFWQQQVQNAEMLEELKTLMIESSLQWDSNNKGILWAIAFKQKGVDAKHIEETLKRAHVLEKIVIATVWPDGDYSKAAFRDFSFPAENINTTSETAKAAAERAKTAMLELYNLRNAHTKALTSDMIAKQGSSFIIDFWADKEEDQYYIKRIYLSTPGKEQSAKANNG